MDGKQIRQITREGLWYLNGDGSAVYVDFSSCYANYLRSVTTPAYIARMKELNPQSPWDNEGIRDYIKKRTV